MPNILMVTHRGIFKVTEEAGEALQEIGKLIAYPDQEHPDGNGNTSDRVRAELADLAAAIDFYVMRNLHLGERDEFLNRKMRKYKQYEEWNKHGGMSGINVYDD